MKEKNKIEEVDISFIKDILGLQNILMIAASQCLRAAEDDLIRQKAAFTYGKRKKINKVIEHAKLMKKHYDELYDELYSYENVPFEEVDRLRQDSNELIKLWSLIIDRTGGNKNNYQLIYDSLSKLPSSNTMCLERINTEFDFKM